MTLRAWWLGPRRLQLSLVVSSICTPPPQSSVSCRLFAVHSFLHWHRQQVFAEHLPGSRHRDTAGNRSWPGPRPCGPYRPVGKRERHVQGQGCQIITVRLRLILETLEGDKKKAELLFGENFGDFLLFWKSLLSCIPDPIVGTVDVIATYWVGQKVCLVFSVWWL